MTALSSVSVAPLQVVVAGASASAQAANPVLAVPSKTYTGQALLTASCVVPQYTFLPQANGDYVVAPLVGCNGGNPGCCPSLALSSAAASVTQSVVPLTAANSAMVAAINAAPLTYCPADYTSTSGNCCPIGFGLYVQRVMDQTPCFSVLPNTIDVPAQVSAQISALSSILASQQAQAPVVRVASDEVFALSFPLKNGVEKQASKSSSGLPMGAKIGIGIGAGILAILAAFLVLFCIRKKRKARHVRTISNDSDIAAFTAGNRASERKSLASTATEVVSPVWSPQLGHNSYSDQEPMSGQAIDTWDQSKQQYVRTPPPRLPLTNMSMASNSAGFVHPRYSELAGSDYVAPVEADGTTNYPQDDNDRHQRRQRQDGQFPYELDVSPDMSHILPASVGERYELGGPDPRTRY
jgi:hypothetical protein